MDAKEYLIKKEKICAKYIDNYGCSCCPLYNYGCGDYEYIVNLKNGKIEDLEKAIEIVENYNLEE